MSEDVNTVGPASAADDEENDDDRDDDDGKVTKVWSLHKQSANTSQCSVLFWWITPVTN